MISLTVNRKWYEDIKDRVETVDPYFYEEDGVAKVEFDANEEEFRKVSKEFGWIED